LIAGIFASDISKRRRKLPIFIGCHFLKCRDYISLAVCTSFQVWVCVWMWEWRLSPCDWLPVKYIIFAY